MFCPIPTISIDEIEPNLYLGGLAAANDVETLTKYNITHILTINTTPLPRQISGSKSYSNKFIQLEDLPFVNLLDHFDEGHAFIEEGVRSGAVLVHCYYGVSRSASFVISHIMKKYKLNYADAYKLVKKKRSIVSPNLGFRKQLRLFEEMNYTVDSDCESYKNFVTSLVKH